MAAVVEEQVRAAAPMLVAGDAAFEIIGDAGGGDVGAPVETHGVPEYGGQTKIAGGTEDVGAASTVGRTEEAYRGAEDVLEGGVAAGEFFADAAGTLDREPGVGDGVVADEVTGSVDFADEVGTLADVAADKEEGRTQAMLREEIEQMPGPGVIGAVVVGQGELSGITARDEGMSEELRLRIHRRVRTDSGGKAGCGTGAGESDEHWDQCKRVFFAGGAWYVRLSFAAGILNDGQAF